MSGKRLRSMREGDRSEYYAQVLLSGLGLCSPIPRQEDIGFDFLCSLADEESNILTFGSPYMVSVKSVSSPLLKLDPSKTDIRDNSQEHILWLYRQQLPVFLAVVDKDNYQLDLHSLLPVWSLCYEGGTRCGSLDILARDPKNESDEIERPEDCGEREDWKGKHHFKVDIGHPLVSLKLKSLGDKEFLGVIKQRIRLACALWGINERHSQMGIPFFTWFRQVKKDGSLPSPGWYHQQVAWSPVFRNNALIELAPSLASLALNCKLSGDNELLSAIGVLMREAPRNSIPKEIVEALPEIFNVNP